MFMAAFNFDKLGNVLFGHDSTVFTAFRIGLISKKTKARVSSKGVICFKKRKPP